MKEKYFKVIENNVEKEYKIVKIIKHNNISYIVYTEDDEEFFASRYSVVNNKVILDEIKNDDEWDYIDEVLEKDGDTND